MPGAHGAIAVAEAIFGVTNPGGKLPVTMYHSSYINDVQFLDMSMQAGPGRSYRFYTGKPLYPFGFGLSYTSFELSFATAPGTQTLNSLTDVRCLNRVYVNEIVGAEQHHVVL